MTAKNISTAASPTMASPILPSTASSVASADSPVFSNQSVHNKGVHSQQQVTFDEIKKCEQQQKKEHYSNNKRNFSYMNDESLASVISHDDDYHSIASDDFRERKSSPRSMTGEEECDDDDEDAKIKRKAQNRAAQRAFRERKERYVKELEKKIRYVQDSHIYATTQLFQENQHLRSIIYRLESEIGSLKGLPDGNNNKSWSSSIPPPPLHHVFQPTPPTHFTSLTPLQIRPAPIASKPRKIVPKIVPEQKKQKKHHIKSPIVNEIESKQQSTANTSKNTQCASGSTAGSASHNDNTSGQRITFSITTPDSLRASSKDELLRKSEQIQTVQLYPDHSHPANCLLEANKKQQQAINTPALSPQYTSSVASSVVSSCAEEEEEKRSMINGEDQEFKDILKPFLDTRGNFDFSAFNDQNQMVDVTSTSSPALLLNQLLGEAASCSDNNDDWNSIMKTTY